MTFLTYESVKYRKNIAADAQDSLIEEGPFKILLNQAPFTITMRTPGDDEELAVGLMVSEGVIKPVGKCSVIVESVEDEDYVTMDVSIEGISEDYINNRNFLSIASCGICGQTELRKVEGSIEENSQFNPSELKKMFEIMAENQGQFKATGGCHAAAGFSLSGELLSIKEDVGRHNAVDKVVGELLLQKKLSECKVMLVSGRVSYEIVIKAFRAKIPVLASVSAPSSLAVDYAKELGITLFAFCRQENSTCYAGTHRIKNTEIKN